MENDNHDTRLKMLKMSAFDSGDDDESARCFTKFSEVWRPVLRKDSCKAEAAKYRLNRIVNTNVS